MSFFKRIIILSLSIGSAMTTFADEPSAAVNYTPQINGTIRSRWEMETQEGESRFQVRNARLSLTGKIAPQISYFLNTDLCDRGKMKILDAWGRIELGGGASFQAGQFRMPFGVEPFRAPHTYFFANRSFIGKQVCNFRSVGAKVGVDISPFTIEAGVFNPTTIGDHETWNKKVTAAGQVILRTGDFKFVTGGQTVMTEGTRANLIDGAAGWSRDRWTVEAEYMHEHFTHDAYKACHAYNLFANYAMPVKAGIFNRLSFQGRWDGMTRHANDPARNRITVGSTLTYSASKVFADLRANYEKYIYRHNAEGPQGERDKVVLEMVIRF